MKEGARIQFLHKRMGLVPGWGGTTRLCRIVGPKKALFALASGKAFSADEAYSFGLVDKVVPLIADTDSATIANEWLEKTFSLSTFDLNVLRSMKTVVMNVERSDSIEESIKAEGDVIQGLWGQGANLRAVNAVKTK